MKTMWAINKVQLRILRRDPAFLVIMFGMPLAVMPLLRNTMGLSLVSEGFDGANGAELVVPGQTVTFGFFVAGSVGFSVFREHGWRTWDRLRLASSSPVALLAGFGLPWVVIHVAYQILLLVVGGLIFGLRLNGSIVAEFLVIIAFALAVVALMLASVAINRTVNQHQAVVSLGAMVFGGIGGALVPIEQLPGWAQTIAPALPTYWAMEGHRAVFLDGGGVSDVLTEVGVLLLMAGILVVAAAGRFRSDETKEFFA